MSKISEFVKHQDKKVIGGVIAAAAFVVGGVVFLVSRKKGVVAEGIEEVVEEFDSVEEGDSDGREADANE